MLDLKQYTQEELLKMLMDSMVPRGNHQVKEKTDEINTHVLNELKKRQKLQTLRPPRLFTK